MPAWITLSAENLNAYLVAEQMTALREEALGAGQTDPFGEIAPDVIRKVRSFIASNPANLVDAAELTIPPELKTDVCYLIIGPLLGRLGLAQTEDQRAAIAAANKTLSLIAEKKLVVSKPVDAVTPEVEGLASGPKFNKPCRTFRREDGDGS